MNELKIKEKKAREKGHPAIKKTKRHKGKVREGGNLGDALMSPPQLPLIFSLKKVLLEIQITQNPAISEWCMNGNTTSAKSSTHQGVGNNNYSMITRVHLSYIDL